MDDESNLSEQHAVRPPPLSTSSEEAEAPVVPAKSQAHLDQAKSAIANGDYSTAGIQLLKAWGTGGRPNAREIHDLAVSIRGRTSGRGQRDCDQVIAWTGRVLAESASTQGARTNMQREFGACSPDRLFAACLHVVALRGWKVQYTDPTTRTVSFVASGTKRRIGGGMEFSALVETADEDRARVSLGASTAGFQSIRVFDWGERREITELFFVTLARALPDVSEPRRPAQSASAVGELERLAELHARGALDDDEFRRAKQRLLDE